MFGNAHWSLCDAKPVRSSISFFRSIPFKPSQVSNDMLLPVFSFSESAATDRRWRNISFEHGQRGEAHDLHMRRHFRNYHRWTKHTKKNPLQLEQIINIVALTIYVPCAHIFEITMKGCTVMMMCSTVIAVDVRQCGESSCGHCRRRAGGELPEAVKLGKWRVFHADDQRDTKSWLNESVLLRTLVITDWRMRVRLFCSHQNTYMYTINVWWSQHSVVNQFIGSIFVFSSFLNIEVSILVCVYRFRCVIGLCFLSIDCQWIFAPK